MSYCSHCGAELAKGAEVCEHCGKRIGLIAPGAGPDTRSPERKKRDAMMDEAMQAVRYCSHCGVESPDGKFCSHCGKPFDSKPA